MEEELEESLVESLVEALVEALEEALKEALKEELEEEELTATGGSAEEALFAFAASFAAHACAAAAFSLAFNCSAVKLRFENDVVSVLTLVSSAVTTCPNPTNLCMSVFAIIFLNLFD